MPLSEACALWIEQRIEEEIQEQEETGKSLRAIGREIAKEIEKHFEAKVAPETLAKKASRLKSVTNVTENITPQNNIGNKKIQSPKDEIKAPRQHRATGKPKGGKREGAGRKPKYAEKPETSNQRVVWLGVVNRMARLSEYMLANCETKARIPQNIKNSFIRYFDTLEVFKNEL